MQLVVGAILSLIVALIALKIEYSTFVPQTVDNATRAEHKVRELKRQVEAEQEAEALQARLNAKRIEKENQAREVALRLEQQRAQQENDRRQRERQAEEDRRRRQEYVDNYRRTHHGCDPGTNRYCTYVQGQAVGCSCY